MPTRIVIPAIAFALAAAFALVAVLAGRDTANRHSAMDHGKPPAAKPAEARGSVEFATPGDGTSVGSTFTAKVKLHDFKIDAKSVGKAPRPGYGHLHFQLDEGRYDHPKYSGENGKIAVKLGVDGQYSPALAPQITYRNIPKGKHQLEIYLAHNNHVDTGAEDELELLVE
jgi:hypothetical protein